MFSTCCKASTEDLGDGDFLCNKCYQICDVKEKLEDIVFKVYDVRFEYSGYVRGDSVYHVEAASEEDAEHKVRNGDGTFIEYRIVRDDTSGDKNNCQCYGELTKEEYNKNILSQIEELKKQLKDV